MAAAMTDQITAWFMSPYGVLLKILYQPLLLVNGTVAYNCVYVTNS